MKKEIDEQPSAASHGKGAACVIAGAGTGKTTSLINRIEYLLQKAKIPANKILITTFTRKATAELYIRCVEKLGDEAHKLKITTIDSAIFDFSQHAVRLGLMNPFRLLDEAGRWLLLLDCTWEASGKRGYKPNWIYYAKESGLIGLIEMSVREKLMNLDEKKIIQEKIKNKVNSLNPHHLKHGRFTYYEVKTMVKNATERYYDKIKELGLKDYNIINKELLLCLQKNKSFAKKISSEFRTILVDEFQDTSNTQFEILLELSGKKNNLWVVGDPCQQIYEWRGAGTDNFKQFIKITKAKKYNLKKNYRSTQAILNGAYNFLSAKVPQLKRGEFLSELKSDRSEKDKTIDKPIYSGDLGSALFFVKQLLDSRPSLKSGDVAILSRDLTSNTIEEIKTKANQNGLQIQFHSSRADRAMEEIIGSPPHWKGGKALVGLYSNPKIKKQISKSLDKKDFSDLRAIRSLANAAEALDSTLPPNTFTFREAWPVLQKTQDREVPVSAAVTEKGNKIQVMTIHASKGLEFPVVLLMTLGKKIPNKKSYQEDCRLAYVGVTRAKDLCILVHTKPPNAVTNDLLKNFGLVKPIRKNQENFRINFQIKDNKSLSPLIAATHLELNEECQLKFAAYHEGRYLQTWNEKQSMGSRIHKALEYYLHKGLPTKKDIIEECFNKGYLEGDSAVRKISPANTKIIKKTFETVTTYLSKKYMRAVAIEHKYRYIQQNGQVEGVVDAILEKKDGTLVLNEWKNTKLPSKKNKAYEYQVRAGALGIDSQKSFQIKEIEIVPLLSNNLNSDAIKFPVNETFLEESRNIFNEVFIDLNTGNYSTRKGDHCKFCQLKTHCPLWA